MSIALLVLSMIAAPVQDHAGHATPAAPAATALTVDTPIERIVADPKGKAVLDETIPTLTKHPMYDEFKSLSLAQLQPMSNGQLTDEQIAKVKDGLAAIK